MTASFSSSTGYSRIACCAELAGAEPVRCTPVYRTEWDTLAYPRRFACCVVARRRCAGDSYIALFHSRTHSQELAHAARNPAMNKLGRMLGYAGSTLAAGRFARALPWRRLCVCGDPPLRPRTSALLPILWLNTFTHARPTPSHMAPRRVVYPCGLVRWADGWLASYGVHDERAVLRVFARNEVEGEAGALPSWRAP